MQRILKIPYLASLFLLAYMPLHIFLSQWLSSATGGLEAWKVGKDVLLGVVLLFTICLVWKQGKATRLFKTLLGVTFLYGLLHLILWAFHPDIYTKSAMLGTIYNVRLLLFVLLGMGAVLLWPAKFVFSSALKWVLVVSSIVAALGVLQYFLPPDTLAHFGYSLERGVRPAFAIDDHPDFPRIMSTLREPNALGAYLILPITALTLLFFRVKDSGRKYLVAGSWLMHALAIFLTFSRSAWLALVLAILLAVWWQHKQRVLSVLKRFWPVMLTGVLLVAVLGFTQRNTHFFQQYIAHSNSEEQVADLDSNDYHSLLIKQGLEGVRDNPVGHGPGTAGIVSIQNPGGGQLTENYYIQIAYEVGIVGLGLFVAANFLVYALLWRRRDMFGLILCASFWGYVVTNMLLHTWSNEAVAAQWWILAGMAIAATPLVQVRAVRQRTKPSKRP
jgi:O-antigen ligase